MRKELDINRRLLEDVHSVFVPFQLLAVLLLNGCQRDELCYLHPDRARVELQVDWSRSRLSPNSATAVVYRADGSRFLTVSMENPHRQVLDLPVGDYSIVLFNESMEPDADHAATLGFRNVDRLSRFEVYAKEDDQTRATRSTRLHPDTLAVDRVLNLSISEAMVNKVHLTPTHKNEIALYPVDTVVRLQPKRVFTLTRVLIRFKHFNGYLFSSLYPPMLHGMAESYSLGTDRYSLLPIKHSIRFSPIGRDESNDLTSFSASFTVIGLLDNRPPDQVEHPDYRLEIRLLHPDGVVIKDIDLVQEARLKLTREAESIYPQDQLDIEIDVELDRLVGVGDGIGGWLEDWNDQDVPLDGPPILWFSPNGGDGEHYWWRYPVGTLLTIPACSFVPPLSPPAPLGVRFVEWNTSKDGRGQAYQPGDRYAMPKDGGTLFAIWK